MEGKDLESYKKLQEYLNRCWGFSKKTLDWLNAAFDDVSVRKIDPIYSSVLGPDLRVRYPLTGYTEEEDKEDLGWVHFRRLFYNTYTNLVITREQYETNLYPKGKQKVKLNKVLSEHYLNKEYGLDYFFADLKQAFSNGLLRDQFLNPDKWDQRLDPRTLSSKASELKRTVSAEDFEKAITRYILYANELIGRFKKGVKNDDYELVITANWVDWILSSTAERWSSCWNIESDNGFWTGIPFLFDDRNRVMAYITNKKNGKKEYYGMTADHFSSRSWALLSHKNEIHLVRWFPGTYKIPSDLKKFTGLPIHNVGTAPFGKSKYKFMENIRFHDGKSYIIPYLDRYGYEGRSEEPPFFYTDGGNTGTSGNIGSMWYPRRASHGNTHLFDLGVNLWEREFMASCPHCGKKGLKNDDKQMKQLHNGNFVCVECFEKLYDTCESCGESFLKTDLREVTKHYKKICPSCVSNKFTTCSVCGELHLKDRVKNGICQECAATNPNVVSCRTCGEHHFIKKFKGVKVKLADGTMNYFCNDTCLEPFVSFMKETNRWNNMRKASCCNSYYNYDELECDISKSAPHTVKTVSTTLSSGKKCNNIEVNYGEYLVCPEHNTFKDEKQLEFKFTFPRKKKVVEVEAALAS